jgi:hypothetical protein
LVFFRVHGCVFWHYGDFSGSVEVFSDIIVIFLLFFRVSGCVFWHYGDLFCIFQGHVRKHFYGPWKIQNKSPYCHKTLPQTLKIPKKHHYVRKHFYGPWKIQNKPP